ncbi:hypothetical protein GQ43DRAFT_438830 [Delitschia confertaspora ATCC 74209]|uniref:C2H2-type domain-containing protein n=1 Tax=Delitschia confertaspora ATCC 74209 TaxID=1513339 RepID=A0A9P4JQ02_9PLEO|nr:hypothetical protein GQ43DRAFT_438830 [Delitschia confertaspora ATCC 74209]
MAAAVASHHSALWPGRRDQPLHIPSTAHMSGFVPSYEASSRMVTSTPSSGAFQATTSHMDLSMPLFQTHSLTTSALTTSVPYQPGAFAFDTLSVNPYNMQQGFGASYPPAFSQGPSYSGSSEMHGLPTVREVRSGLPIVERAPQVKVEISSPIQPSQPFSDSTFGVSKPALNSENRESGSGIAFSTDVDTLMKAIQAKSKTQQRPQPPKVQKNQPSSSGPAADAHHLIKEEEPKGNQKPKKRYQCSMPDCRKVFSQKTHLEIHTRAHTGVKPFVCKEPSCGQRFSQLGNLKTHERRHTGERPYNCETCGKTFAQLGNVRAHKIVHKQIKPYTCKLDDCGKQFTQLGNMKSHQNKFHADTLRYLTQKFAAIREFDFVTAQDKELWEYFASMYKNSNKGIKGRGKDRRISATPVSHASSFPSAAAASNRGYPGTFQQHTGSGRSSPCSSLSSDEAHKASEGYDFSAPMDTGFPSQSNGYSDAVFPERRLY